MHPDPYDAVAYPSHALPQTHPDRLAAIATAFGMSPADPASCRVLEIGCGDGANLIPMAAGLPASRFLGIDLAEQPIARARADAERLAPTNLEFRRLDVRDLPPDAGEFDYIVAHGVFSWVPDEVRSAILALCARHLAPHGVAYISYNAYPGCHLRDLVRRMMLYHVRDLAAPAQRVDEGIALARFLVEARPEKTLDRQLLERELTHLEAYGTGPVYHDDLCEQAQAFYVHEFVARAAVHGLAFLGEADFFEMQDRHLSPAVADRLRALDDDPIAKEQYLDFLKLRRFRQTLLRRDGTPWRRPTAADLRRLSLRAALREERSPSGEPVFVAAGGARLSVAHAPTITALRALAARWPAAIAQPALLTAALRDTSPPRRETEAAILEDSLFAGACGGAIELTVGASAAVAEPGERPACVAVARHQAAAGAERVTSALHQTIALDDAIGRALLPLLDGSRDDAGLIASLVGHASAGRLRLDDGTGAALPEAAIAPTVAAGLRPALRRLARLGLLVA